MRGGILKNFLKLIHIEWCKRTNGLGFISAMLIIFILSCGVASICIDVYVDNWHRPEVETGNVYKQLINQCRSYQRKIESGQVSGEEEAVMRGKINLFEYYLAEHSVLYDEMAQNVRCDWYIWMEQYYIQLALRDMDMDYDKELVKKVDDCLANDDVREYYRMELEYVKSVREKDKAYIYDYYYAVLIEHGYPIEGQEYKLIMKMLDTELEGSVYMKNDIIRNRYALEHGRMTYADDNIMSGITDIKIFNGIWPTVVTALDIIYLVIGIYIFTISAKVPRRGVKKKIKADSIPVVGSIKTVASKLVVILCLAALLCALAFVIMMVSAGVIFSWDEFFVPVYLLEGGQVLEIWAIIYALGRLARSFGYIAIAAFLGTLLFSVSAPKKYLFCV